MCCWIHYMPSKLFFFSKLLRFGKDCFGNMMSMFCYATGMVLFRVSTTVSVYECYTLRHIYAYFLDCKVSAYTLKIAISNSAATLFGKVFHCKQSLTQIQGYSKNQNGEERHCCGFERSMVVRSSRADLSISNANVLLLSYSPQKNQCTFGALSWCDKHWKVWAPHI